MNTSEFDIVWVWQVCAFVAASVIALVAVLSLRRLCRQFQSSFQVQMSERLSRSFVFVDADRLFLVNLFAIGLTFLAALVFDASVLTALFVAAIVGFVPALLMRTLELRRKRAIDQQLPDLFLQLASVLRSGLSISAAIEQVASKAQAPARQELEVLARERRLGLSLNDALLNLRERVPCEAIYLFVSLIRVSHAQGGGLADALVALAQSCRRKLLLRAKLAALTSQARLQAQLMSVIPLLVAVALFLIEPDAMRHLWLTPFGWKVSALILGLLSLGAFWVRCISRGRK